MPRHNGRHFPEDIFKCIFLRENFWILNKISLKYVPDDLIDNMAALVQIMAWCRLDEKQAIIWASEGAAYWHIYLNNTINWIRKYHLQARDKINQYGPI